MASRIVVPPPPLPQVEPVTIPTDGPAMPSFLSDLPRWARIAIGAAAIGAVAFAALRISRTPATPSGQVVSKKSGAAGSADAGTTATTPAASAKAAPAATTAAAVSAPAGGESTAAAPAAAAAAAAAAAPAKDALEFKRKGNDAYKNKNYKDAILHYSKALEITPENDEERSVFFCNRAACHLFLDNIDEVISDCSSAIALKPKYVKAYNRRAQAYEKQAKLHDALYDYTAICFIERFTNEAAQKAAERVLASLGKEGAIEHLKNKVPTLPSSALIRMYFDGYKGYPVPEVSLESLEEKLAANPTDALALHQRALLKLAAHDFLASFTDVKAAQPGLKDRTGESDELKTAYLNNSSLLASFFLLQGEADIAVATCDSALTVEACHVQLLVKRATAKVEKGVLEDAMKDFESALAINRKDADALYQRGQVHALLQKVEKAENDFRKSVETNNAPYPAYVQLAVMQVSTQNLSGATRTFEQAIKKFPEESNVFAYYGEVLMALQKFPEAEKHLETARKLDPTNATPLMHLGWLVLQARSDVMEAVRLLNEAIKLDPRSDQIYNRLAAILIQQGLFDQAIELYNKAIEHNHNVQDLANTISCREAAIAQRRVMLENPSILPAEVVTPR